ncbi:sarcosine oxidase subunit gamma [Tropicibacter naphthalenivorans]|uniref:Sarcosine oxidase, gamma subunit family n=1 Tax=Tropicibacter naphthalenivorans TaxID=441103 RepID=A0A0P1G883_9RHOB|nr:sarcosine oxidase subunit gamma [Tropicibacter naphthalenivorans]CUH77854.1 sarcosine oxidase, gamma subunit family [Tropicibacter naphthalenivorans]SMC95679.1 sarcosine oxidase subunit gamma [Tropicibacter naphthalenivorans]
MDRLTAVSPGADLLPVRQGALTLEEVLPGEITSIAPFRGQRKAVTQALLAALGVGFPEANCLTRKGELRCVWMGRDLAFLMGARLTADLGGLAAVTDQSDGWIVLKLSGAGAEDVLARLVPADLRAAAFPEGAAIRTQLGHMNVSVARTGGGLQIMGFRSMARTLVQEIADAMASVAARAGAG